MKSKIFYRKYEQSVRTNVADSINELESFSGSTFKMSEAIELGESHPYHPSPQTALLICLKNENFEEFQYILKQNVGSSIDINHLYGGPDNKSLLEMACSCKNRAKFVELLLKYGADVNLNKLQGKAPIHLAVLHSDYDTLKLLVESSNTIVDKPDTSGHTALTLAAQGGKDDFVRLLQKHLPTETQRTEKRFQSCIKIDMRDEEHKPLVQDTDNPDHSNISVADPDLPLQKGKPTESLLSSFLARNYEGFASEATETNVHHDKNARRLTYLQYACEFGLTPFVRLLLDLQVDPNETSLRSRSPPIMIAAYNGHYNIVKLLVDTRKITYSLVDGDNLLHIMFIGDMMRDSRCAESDSTRTFGDQNQDFYKCLRYLLDTIPSSKLDVNLLNRRDKTVLHYAISADNRDVIRLLLEKGAYMGVANSKGEMPVRLMKVATLEYFLNAAITSKRHPLRRDHRIIVDYNLLVCKHLDPLTVKETKPLVAISEVRQLRPLLKHPFFTAFLDLKWYIIMNRLTLVNYFFYTVYVLLLSLYLLIAYTPITTKMVIQNNSTTGSNNNMAFQNKTVLSVHVTEGKFQEVDVILWYLVTILNSILFFREFLQFVVYSNSNKYRYVKNPENWIELALISIAYVILFRQIDTAETRSLLAVTAIFLSWIELMLLILSHPVTSVHITMFKAVAWNSFKFLLCYLILILAFALSFYLLFKDTSPEFKDIVLAIFRTGIMSTGEYEVSNNPFNSEFGIRHLLFVLFIFLVPIVLFNLLNGVAISDIQGIRNNAELVSTVARVKLIVHMEEIVSDLLSFLDKLAFHYNTLIRRHSDSEAQEYCSELKRRYQQNINLFSTLSEDGEVYITPNQSNAIFIKSRKLEASPMHKSNTNSRLPKLFIATSTVEIIKEKLSQRTGIWEKSGCCEAIPEASRVVTNLQEIYKSHLIQQQNASARTEDRLEIIEQKLAEITVLLKEKL